MIKGEKRVKELREIGKVLGVSLAEVKGRQIGTIIECLVELKRRHVSSCGSALCPHLIRLYQMQKLPVPNRRELKPAMVELGESI
jgi:hypothetical protein